MGMDVYGNKPTTEAGEYFRNNVWGWHPLAGYVCMIAPEIAINCTHWHTNEGDGLNKPQSLALARKLRAEIANGKTKEYAEEWERQRQALPRKTCDGCKGTGIRTDKVGVEHGKCYGCDGIGTCEHFDAHYGFSVKNVERFTTFLEGCGGFGIR